MGGVLCLFGTGAIALAALIMIRAYSAFIRRRVAEYTAFLGFLGLMNREILCFLYTPAELAVKSNDALLEEIGFLGALRNGSGLADAFSAALPRLHLSAADADFLALFFERFGQGTRESELHSLDACIEHFSARTAAEEAGAADAIRLASTLFALVAIGLIILLL